MLKTHTVCSAQLAYISLKNMSHGMPTLCLVFVDRCTYVFKNT